MAKKDITIKDLLESGAHFGHQKHRWNPKMKSYIFQQRNSIYIINLAKTMQQIRKGHELVADAVKKRKSILFVGTKKQAKGVIREYAEEAGEPYVSERWLGGMLTNLLTIRKSVNTLKRIEKCLSAGGEGLTKKEISLMGKEQIKLDRNLSGIRSMRKIPGLLIIVDSSKEHIAVKEANKLGIPILGLIDTNCDPDPIDHVIPCNDDSLKSIKLILGSLTQEVIDRKNELQLAIESEKTEEEKKNLPNGRTDAEEEKQGERKEESS